MSKRWCCGRLTCHHPDPSAVPLSSVKPPDLFFLSSFLLNARWDLSAPRNLSFPSWAPGSFSFWITNSSLLKVPCRWSSTSLWPDDFPWSRAAAWSSSLFRCFFAPLCLQPKDCMFFFFYLFVCLFFPTNCDENGGGDCPYTALNIDGRPCTQRRANVNRRLSG